MNVSPKVVTAGKIATVAFATAVAAGCASQTWNQTAGMPRSPAVADPTLKTEVSVDPCMRAGFEVYKRNEMTAAQFNGLASTGNARTFGDYVLVKPASMAQEDWGAVFGTIIGAGLGYGLSQAVGANGGVTTAITAGGAIAGGVTGNGVSQEMSVGRIAELKACGQFLKANAPAGLPIPAAVEQPYAPRYNYRYVAPITYPVVRPDWPFR